MSQPGKIESEALSLLQEIEKPIDRRNRRSQIEIMKCPNCKKDMDSELVECPHCRYDRVLENAPNREGGGGELCGDGPTGGSNAR
jgi:predicted Zn-ribbon and HTH transcriptional regulator